MSKDNFELHGNLSPEKIFFAQKYSMNEAAEKSRPSIPPQGKQDKDTFQILVKWNQTEANFPEDKCIHHLFESQVETTPDAIALIFGEKSITYKDLNNKANQLALHLQTIGVCPEVLVGVYLERSIEMIVALLGILKAGGAYLPLDPSYPEKPINHMIEDANIKVMVTQKNLHKTFPGDITDMVFLDEDLDKISEKNPGNLPSNVTPENLAYVIYTSGSIGKPKGVMVTHSNLVNSTTARWDYYCQPVTGFLLLSSFAFDSSVAGIFWTLTQGGFLVLPKDKVSQNISKLCELIASKGISHFLCIPSLYKLILVKLKKKILNSLQTVIVAGEVCPSNLIKDHQKHFPNVSIFNEYGPTEATVWSSVYMCEANEKKAIIPIGSPVKNTKIYILDDNLKPVPVGVPGQLFIGGKGVARGYLNHPDLTAEKFLTDFHKSIPCNRIYATGDQARYLPDGNIEFLGRKDRQVKIRGFRIQLEEIETVLASHPDVKEAMVVLQKIRDNKETLVAYTVMEKKDNSNQEIKSSIPDLKNFLSDKLPAHTIPSKFEFLNKIPKLPNGKFDQKAIA